MQQMQRSSADRPMARRTFRIGIMLFGLMLSFAVSTPARAQSWEAPRYSSKDMQQICRMLGLGDDACTAFHSLHEGYLLRHGRAVATLNAYYDEVRRLVEQAGDDSIWNETGEAWEKFQKHHDRLCAGLLEDMRLMLNDEQAARWPRVERMLRRRELIHKGELRGSNVDLVALITKLELDPEIYERIDPMLKRYEIELDESLVNFNDFVNQYRNRGMELYEAGEMEALAVLYKQGSALDKRTSDLNFATLETLANALPPEHAATLRGQFNQHVFPEIYADSKVAQAFRLLDETEDLTAAQRETLSALRQSYQRSAKAANAQWAQAIRSWEAARTIEDLIDGAETPESVTSAQSAREDLDARTIDQIASMLTEAQRDRLPGLQGKVILPEINFDD